MTTTVEPFTRTRLRTRRHEPKSPAERLADLRADLADPRQAEHHDDIRRAIDYLTANIAAASILEA